MKMLIDFLALPLSYCKGSHSMTAELSPTNIKLDDYCLLWDHHTIWPNRTGGSMDGVVPDCHLVAGLFSNEIFQFRNDPHRYICSSHLRVLYLILRYLRCSISFVDSESNFGGYRDNQTNRWTGILSLFDTDQMDTSAKLNQTESKSKPYADFIPHLFSLAYDRDEVIYMDMVIPQNHLLTILSYPKYSDSNSPTKLFDCFELSVWLLILLSITMFGLVNIGNNPSTTSTRFLQANLYQIIVTYLELFAILFGQGSDVLLQSSKNQHRNPQFIWLISAFLFRQFYSTDITAMFLSRTPIIVDRFDQITKQDHSVTILIETNSSTEVDFTSMFPWASDKLLHIDNKELSTVEMVERLIEQNTVLVTHRQLAAQTQSAYRSQVQLHVSKEGYVILGGNFAIRKSLNSVYRKKLSRLFRSIHYFGLTEKIDRTLAINNFVSLHKRRPELGLGQLLVGMNQNFSRKIDHDHHQLPTQPNSISSTILVSIYLSGVVLACLLLIIEIVHFCLFLRCSHKLFG